MFLEDHHLPEERVGPKWTLLTPQCSSTTVDHQVYPLIVDGSLLKEPPSSQDETSYLEVTRKCFRSVTLGMGPLSGQRSMKRKHKKVNIKSNKSEYVNETTVSIREFGRRRRNGENWANRRNLYY